MALDWPSVSEPHIYTRNLSGADTIRFHPPPHKQEKVIHWTLQAADSHNNPGLKTDLGKIPTLQGG